MQTEQQFASDNYAGMCKEALKAMQMANMGHDVAYGDDVWTSKASDAIRALLGTDCEVFFVFNGTAANSLALAQLCRSYHSVICSNYAHVETDECGAPEFFSNGAKLLAAQTSDGKLTPEAIEKIATARTDIHYPKPEVVTITQSTETGLLYSIEEIKQISAMCKDYGLRLHMDGARFANACAALGCSPAEISWKAGVDVLCFGGTKNGLAVGEAVVFFNRALADDFAYRCKQAGQLASKLRFLTAPWVGLLENNVWLRNANQANGAAKHFSDRIGNLKGVSIQFPVQANAVFVQFDPTISEGLKSRGWRFYDFIGGSSRFMFSWDADIAQVDALADDIAELSRSSQG